MKTPSKTKILIDATLVRRLVATQFPQWKNLSVQPVEVGGWDNRTFHLGEDMLVRMPSAAGYAPKVEIEQKWLPRLAPLLPLPIPKPLGMGRPGEGYPWNWSIYQWIEGETAAAAPKFNMNLFATDLAQFLIALQNINFTGGPEAGPHNFYRGGSLTIYDAEARQAISILKHKIDASLATKLWELALISTWSYPPVWVHGDISPGNLLVRDGKLSAVIDFGGMTIGDPACDLVVAWTMFDEESRRIFRTMLPLDNGTWDRGRGWALWKALIVSAGLIETNVVEAERSWHVIEAIFEDYKKEHS